MGMQTVRGLGWDWRENGVVLKVKMQGDGGRIYQQEVFVPLSRVWKEFSQEFAAVGCPLPMTVGEPLSVGGFFSSIVSAVKSVAKPIAKATGITAVTKAAAKVASVAANYAQHAVKGLGSIPLVGPLAKGAAGLMALPLSTVSALANGGRIDRVALGSLKSAIASVKEIAPYAQTVLSFVPGVGQGLSGAIGASMALASGQSISDSLMAGVRGAIPGGPLAQAAFSISADVLQGKPIVASAINGLPGVSPAAKVALLRGLQAAQGLARGQRVDQVLVDQALKQLPPAVAKAVQIGAAMGTAKGVQEAARAAAGAASGIAAQVQRGVAAANQLKALPAGMRAPVHLANAVQSATQAKATLGRVLVAAQQGNTAAKQIVAATRMLGGSPVRVGLPAQMVPHYVGAPLSHHRARSPFSSLRQAQQLYLQHPAFAAHRPSSVFARSHF